MVTPKTKIQISSISVHPNPSYKPFQIPSNPHHSKSPQYPVHLQFHTMDLLQTGRHRNSSMYYLCYLFSFPVLHVLYKGYLHNKYKPVLISDITTISQSISIPHTTLVLPTATYMLEYHCQQPLLMFELLHSNLSVFIPSPMKTITRMVLFFLPIHPINHYLIQPFLTFTPLLLLSSQTPFSLYFTRLININQVFKIFHHLIDGSQISMESLTP